MNLNNLIIIQTFKGTEEECGCKICGTYYKKGKHISPFPKCGCGNITMFDITDVYVRFATSWPYVGHNTIDNWEEAILNQIKTNGKPTHILEDPNKNEANDFAISLKY